MAEKNAFAGACINLFSQLWAQLEPMATGDCAHGDSAGSAADRRLEIFRLELVVLLDACRAERWRMLLDRSQRRALERCLSEVFDCLNTRFEEAPQEAIAMAQNRLLDAVLEQHRGYQPVRRIDLALRRVRA